MITNLMISLTCFICYFLLKNPSRIKFVSYWKKFFLVFGISTIFGGLGHLLFYYFGTPGKFPCWFLGFVSSFLATKAFFSVDIVSDKARKNADIFLWIKTIALMSCAFILQNFIFIIIDSAITYLFIGGGLGLRYYKNGITSLKYSLIAIGLLIPPVFIFLLKLSPHIWFNKDDLSHMFMIGTIIFFYLGANHFSKHFANCSNVS